MGIFSSTEEKKQEINQEPPAEEKKIKVDPSKVLPAPQLQKCGADNLKLKPFEINPIPVEPDDNNK